MSSLVEFLNVIQTFSFSNQVTIPVSKVDLLPNTSWTETASGDDATGTHLKEVSEDAIQTYGGYPLPISVFAFPIR